jgi:hypothetical protein
MSAAAIMGVPVIMVTNEFQAFARRRGRRRNVLAALLISSTVATVGAGAMSLAQFTDTKASSGSWSAGTIILGVSPSTAFTATGILPGASGSQTVTVSNTGTGDLRYAMSSTSTNTDSKGLAAQLDLTIKQGTCPSSGTTVFTGKVSAAAFGSNVQGANAGDRNVAAGASEDLCFAWSFPLASGNAYQSATTTATFTFDAEQTLNN